MTKTEIARRLHEMVDERLFGNKPWPVGKESANGVHTTLLELGLMEYVPGMDQSFRNTILGKELHVDLLEAFMGLWDEFELPEILEMYGLIKKQDVQHLRQVLSKGADWEQTWQVLSKGADWEQTWQVLSKGADWEQTFKEYVRRAYSAFYNPTQSLN